MALRILSMGGKFGLLFAMARAFSPELVGSFGLASTLITFAICITGLEFYVFTNRLFRQSNAAQRLDLLACQLSVSASVMCAIWLVSLTTPVLQNLLPPRLVAFLLPLALLEYLGQELYRALVVFDRQLDAAVALFLRTGLWCLIAGMYYLTGSGDFEFLFVVWLICDAAAVAFGAARLSSEFQWRRLASQVISLPQIRRGLLAAMPFLLLSISLRTVEYIDRLFIDANVGKAALGIYTYYWSVASVIQSLLVVSVINVWLPRLMSLATDAHEQRLGMYRALLQRMSLGGAVLAVIAWFAARFAATQFGDGKYLGNSLVFALLILASFLAALAQAPQLSLYTQGRDKVVVGGGIAAGVLSITLNAILVPAMGLTGAAIAYLIGAAAMVAIFHFAVYRTPQRNSS